MTSGNDDLDDPDDLDDLDDLMKVASQTIDRIVYFFISIVFVILYVTFLYSAASSSLNYGLWL